MDTGSARSRFNIYGQKVYQGISWNISLERSQVIQWNTYIYCNYHLWIFIGATYYFKLVLHPLDKMILIKGTSFLTCYIQVVTTRPSSLDVAIVFQCLYIFRDTLAPIHVPNYASSVCITIFFLLQYNMYDTCVSCCLL